MAFKLGRQDSAEKRKKAQEEAKAVMLLARECLTDEKFKRYKEKAFEVARLIDEAIDNLDELDPVKYAFKMKELVIARRYNRLLLKDIKQEAKMEIKAEKKEEK